MFLNNALLLLQTFRSMKNHELWLCRFWPPPLHCFLQNDVLSFARRHVTGRHFLFHFELLLCAEKQFFKRPNQNSTSQMTSAGSNQFVSQFGNRVTKDLGRWLFVDHLVERSLPTPEVCGSNLVIGKNIILTVYCHLYRKDVNKE